jgi:methionine-rich copper-binding protein CopC
MRGSPLDKETQMQIVHHPALISSVMAVALALAPLAAAQAHAKLVSSNPAAGATVAPTSSIDLGFSEEISEKLSGAAVSDASGAKTPTAAMLEPNDPKGLMVMLTHPLKPGVYTVAWHAVASDDGHRTQGSFSFTVK